MARDIYELTVRVKGAREAQREVKGLSSGLGGLKTAFGLLAGAAVTREIIEFGRAAFDAASESQSMENALTKTLGSAQAYTAAIQQAQEATRGMVSETTLASNINTLMASGLARTTQEAAQLTRAGSVLVPMFEASGASYEKFIRLMQTGNDVLLDNFGLTKGQVSALQAQIVATTGISTEEAKLQAVRELLLASSEKYADTLSEGTIATAQAQAAWADLQSEIGGLLSGPGAELLTWSASVTRNLSEQIAVTNELSSSFERAASISGEFATKLSVAALTGNTKALAELEEEARLLNEVLDKPPGRTPRALEAVQAAAAASVPPMRDFVNEAERLKQINLAGELSKINARQAEFLDTIAGNARHLKIANAQSVTQLQVQQAAQEEARQEESRAQQQAQDAQLRAMEQQASEMRSIISSVIQPTLSEVWQAPADERRVDEWARRLATMASGNLNSEWRDALVSQFGGQAFFQPVIDALNAQDPMALSQAVTGILAGGGVPLFDKELIKQRVREQIQQQNLMSELIATVQQELAAEGVTVGIGDVQAAAGGTGLAMAQPIVQDLQTGIPKAISEANLGGPMVSIIAAQVKDATGEMELLIANFNANFERGVLAAAPHLAGIWFDALVLKVLEHVGARGGVEVRP